MNILVTGANGQLGNEMRIVSKNTSDNYIFTDVNQVEGLETTYLDITDIDAIRKMVKVNSVNAIVNCAAWTNVDACENDEKLAAMAEKLNADAPENLAKVMKERNIRMRFGVGGLTKPMCDLLINNQVDCLLDTQDFDLAAVESVKNLKHFRISAGEYADPFNKGAVVNKLDFVILAALEVDVNFNCNVVVGSDGVITGAQGGHPDTAAGAKCTIVIAPLLQGRIPAICSEVTTVTTPGESIDVVITDYGIAINPRRQDLIEAMKGVDLPFKTIEELRDIAYSIVGEPEKVQFGDRVVGIIEARDGTIMDVVRQIKPYEFAD